MAEVAPDSHFEMLQLVQPWIDADQTGDTPDNIHALAWAYVIYANAAINLGRPHDAWAGWMNARRCARGVHDPILDWVVRRLCNPVIRLFVGPVITPEPGYHAGS